jgi:hypothetical protein
VIYVYAVAEALRELPELEGIDGAPLARRVIEGLDVVVSEHDAGVEQTDEAVLAHARVVDGLVTRSTAVLPARFGHGFRDQQSLAETIRDRLTSLHNALDQVRGCVEVGLRVVGEEPLHSRPAGSGRAYMEAAFARHQAAERLGSEIHDDLAVLARSSTHTIATAPRLLLSGAYLVELSNVEAFRARVADLAARHPQLAFASTGPWPPYSFAPNGST